MKYSKGRLFIFLTQKSTLLLFLIGITASLMALKGINQYFSALICLTKTKFLAPVTSNTDESRGMGGFGTVKYIALSGISIPYVLQCKIILRQDVGNHFCHKCTKLHSKSTKGLKVISYGIFQSYH